MSQAFFQKLVADMLLIQTYSATMFPPSLQKGEGFGAEQVAEVRALEEEACLSGARLQSMLQVHTLCHLLAGLPGSLLRGCQASEP